MTNNGCRMNGAHSPGAASTLRPALRTRFAFTLVEMLVIVGIIGLVMAIVLPMLIPFMRSRKLEQAADIVQSACLLARSKAIQQKRVINVTLLEAERVVIMTDYETIREETTLATSPKKCSAHCIRTEDVPGDASSTWADADERHKMLKQNAIERIRALPEGCEFDLRNDPANFDRTAVERIGWTYVFLPSGAVWSLPLDAKNDSSTWSLTTYLKGNRPSGPRIVGPMRSDGEARSLTLTAYSMTGQVRTSEE